jgi:hypothetical protein
MDWKFRPAKISTRERVALRWSRRVAGSPCPGRVAACNVATQSRDPSPLRQMIGPGSAAHRQARCAASGERTAVITSSISSLARLAMTQLSPPRGSSFRGASKPSYQMHPAPTLQGSAGAGTAALVFQPKRSIAVPAPTHLSRSKAPRGLPE